MINKHKSGQAAFLIVTVVMVTILGVAVSTTYQARQNLKDTVYSSQSEQSVACAEAGAERALVYQDVQDEKELTQNVPLLSTESGYNLTDCVYTATITNMPDSTHVIDIPLIPENSVQQLIVDNNSEFDIKFGPSNSALAVYLYDSQNSGKVDRKFYECGTTPSTDFEHLDPDGLDTCSIANLSISSGSGVVRVRPLYADLNVIFLDYTSNTGHLITSVGKSGGAERTVIVRKFFSQMPDGFDEAVVDF